MRLLNFKGRGYQQLLAEREELYEAIDALLKLLEPDCSLEDRLYRERNQQRLINAAKLRLAPWREERAALAKARGESHG